MTSDDLSEIVLHSDIKVEPLRYPHRALQPLFLLVKNKEAKIFFLKEPSSSEFVFLKAPQPAIQRIKVANFWIQKIDNSCEHDLVTASLPTDIREEDLYKVSKALYFSFVESFPKQEIKLAVLHIGENDERMHVHFLLTKKEAKA